MNKGLSSFKCPETSSISSSPSTSSRMQWRLSLGRTAHVSDSPKAGVVSSADASPASLNELLGKSSSSSSNT